MDHNSKCQEQGSTVTLDQDQHQTVNLLTFKTNEWTQWRRSSH